MTLQQLIERSTAISRRLSDSDIPVFNNIGDSDTITGLELKDGGDAGYYVILY